MAVDDVFETEVRFVKGVDEFAHVFHSGAHLRAVIGETRRGKVAVDEALVDGFAGHDPAFEGEHDPGAEDGVEESKGVPDEEQAGRGAVAGVAGIFTGDPVFAGALAGTEAVLDPRVLSDFTLKYGFGVFDSVAGEVFTLCDNADTDTIIVLWNMPEPSFFRHKGHRGLPLIEPGTAGRTVVIRPDGDLVEIGVLETPSELVAGQGFLAGGVDGDLGANLDGFACGVGGGDAEDAAVGVAHERFDRDLFAHGGSPFPGMINHHLVEFRTHDLPALGDGLAVVAVEEIKRLGGAAVGLDEANAVFFDEGGFTQFGNHAEPFQRSEAKGNEGFADVVSGEFFAFQHDDPVAVFGENGGGAGPGWTGADDEHVAIRGVSGIVLHGSGCWGA